MMKVTSRQGARSARPRCERWPARGYFVSPGHRLLYCPIPKVACSSLKFWWAENEERRPQFDPVNDHDLLVRMHRDFGERFTYDQYAGSLGDGPLDDPNWFRFAFVRNPWARLVSAFVNKFVQWAEIAGTVVRDFRRGLPKQFAHQLFLGRGTDDRISLGWLLRKPAAWSEQFTFRQFVNYLTTCDLARADGHWRPQFRFLDDVEFHFIGRFEQLDQDFARLNRMLGGGPKLRRLNTTKYVAERSDDECVADWPLSRLRELPAAPRYQRFYTPSLAETVGQLYAEDIARFEYEFETAHARPAAASMRRAA